MKSFFLSLVLLFGLSANAKTVKSTTRPAEISPSSVTFYKGVSLSNTYVSTVASLIGGAWLSQDVSVSIGFTEEVSETFSINVLGEVIGAQINETQNGEIITIEITTNKGPFNADQGVFEDGFTTYTLVVKKNESADHGYSSTGELTEVSFGEK